MGYFEALILGAIQGLTEFLPVSSSGHLELGAHFLGVKDSNNLLFAIIVHAATALSTIVVFRKDIWVIIKDLLAFQWNESTQFTAKIVLSMIPVGVIGVLFEDQINEIFSGSVVFVAGMLAVTGLLLLLTYYAKPQKGNVTFSKSIVIGIAQAIAILPGISRSGSTISTALLLGVDRAKAARFSFLMVLPPILGAALLKFLDFIKAPASAADMAYGPIIVGFLAAFFSGLIACTWMINIVKKGKLIYFAIYCFVIAGAVLLITLL